MKHLAPSLFRTFACAAGACPDSCCRAGWEIIPDEETLALYRTLPGPVGDRARGALRPGAEPLLAQDEARVCLLLDPDGLCAVQRAFGHGAICRVCREYPRFRREFGGLTEHGVSLSCPTAYARAVAEPPAWDAWEDEAPPTLNDLDPDRYRRLRAGRDLALDLLLREDLPLDRRMGLVRRLAQRVQVRRGRLGEPELSALLRRWETTPVPRRPTARRRPSVSQAAVLRVLAARFRELELLSPRWGAALDRVLDLGRAGRLPEDLFTPEDPEVCARYLWYSLYKYWMDALDDGDLLGRVDRSLAMTRLGMAMDRALPGEGPFLQRISREVEHCEENLAALLENPGLRADFP